MTNDDKRPPTLEDVGARLKAIQDTVAEKKETVKVAEGTARSVGVGFRIGMELVAGVLVGAGLGWFIDDKLNTKPIFMLALIAVGFAASVLSIIRITKNLDEAVGLGRAIREKEAREGKVNKRDQPPQANSQGAWDDDD